MKMRQAGKRKLFGGLLASYAALVYVFLYIPVAAMIAFSFNDSTNNTIWRGFTTKWYALLMSDAEIWGILGTTVAIGAISTLLSVVVGTLGAVGMSRASFAGKGLVSSVLYVPIIIPEIVLAVATLLTLRIAGMGLGMAAMILGNATLVLPYVYITVKARLVGMDPSIEEASMDLGASRSYTFLHVTLPAILPGAVSGAFMAFTLALGDLVICSFLADATTVTLPIKVYSQLKRGIKPEINALSTLILLAFALGIGGWMGIGQAKKRKGLMMAKREEKKELAALESSKAA